MEIDLKERTIVVTGGTSGIGRATVLKLCASGANVVFQGRDIDSAKETISAAAEIGTTPVFIAGDLYNYDSMAELCATAAEQFGGLHGAVANGMRKEPRPVLFRDTAPEDFLGYFDQGSIPKAYLAHAAAPYMASDNYGKIVFITTDGGRVPTPSETMIGSAAAAVIYMSRALAKEMSRDGIRVNCVGITLTKDTPGYNNSMQRRADGTGGTLDKAFAKLEEKMPFGLGSADEVANLVSFLLGAESDGMTGATYSINRGGYFPVYA